MSKINKKLKLSISSNFEDKIRKYINSTEMIKEIIPKNNKLLHSIRKNNKNKSKSINNVKFNFENDNFSLNHEKPKILNSLSEPDLFLSNNISNYFHIKSIKGKKKRLFSGQISPSKTITINKNHGLNSPLILNDINNNKKISLKKSFSYTVTVRKKKKKLKFDDYLKNVKLKSPIELLVEKKENEFNIKLANKPVNSYQKILSKFTKKNFKHIRKNPFKDEYHFIKSKLKNTTKSAENKINNQENMLKFDNDKYKIFRAISKKIKNKILISNKKLSIKEWLEKIKKEKNVMNLERISELKADIEDNKILYTPYNFIKYRKDTFTYFKLIHLIKYLNPDFAYRNRFILSENLGFSLNDDMERKDLK